MATTTNKNSLYIEALTSYILDTKPFHSKLTEIQEIYQFSDSMTVHFDEKLFSTNMMKGAWTYDYYSGGVPLGADGLGQFIALHQLTDPLPRLTVPNDEPVFNNRGAFKIGRDENTDLPLVPLAFDPTCMDGVGLADALVQRNGISTAGEPLLEGLDFFLSQGAYVAQIKQTVSSQPLVSGRFNQAYTPADAPFPILVTLSFTSDSLVITGPATQVTLNSISVTGPGQVQVIGLLSDVNYSPTYTERSNENTIATATTLTQSLANDTTNPASAISKIRALIAQIDTWLGLHPNTEASVQLVLLEAILYAPTPTLPNSYDALLQALVDGGTPTMVGYDGWIGGTTTGHYVDQMFAAYSPSLYFNMYSDITERESGILEYLDLTQGVLTISNIAANPIRQDYEQWTLTAVSTTELLVVGSVTGTIGSATVGSTFSSTPLGFTLAATGPLTVGDVFVLTPASKLTVHYQAPLETWSLIKVNTEGYNRPVFNSARYGYIQSSTGVQGYVTLLDETLPTGTIVLTAVNSSTFQLTDTADSTYTCTVTVGTPYNDGRIAFTIVAGTAYAFLVGDKFFIEITNLPAQAQDLDLYYGFDMGPYDADTIVYNTVDAALANYLETIGFGYDSRFVGYDLTGFGLNLTQAAINGRTFRLRAIPNLTMPLPLQNTVPSNQVNLIADNDPLNPNAATLFDMVDNQTSEGSQSATDPDLQTDLLLWYATTFALEYMDTGSSTWTQIDTVAIGVPYSNPAYGVSFTIMNAAKPFIAAQLNSSMLDTHGSETDETTYGGDVIAWTVNNPNPVQTEPASLVGKNVPRLVMYGASYWNTVPAQWTLTFTAPSVYALQGVYTTDGLNGSPVFSTPVSVDMTTNGASYQNDEFGLHFTVKPGVAGLAPNDTFVFNTYNPAPSYLVYGSVSGWQPDAQIGEWYWNGKIGFTIPAATAQLFDDTASTVYESQSPWTTSNGTVTLNYLRPDTPAFLYNMIAHVDGHWTLYRNGKVVADGATVLSDEYVTLTMPTSTAGWMYSLQIVSHDYHLSMGNDLAIIRTTPGRTPTSSDFVLLERTKDDALQISIQAVDTNHALTLAALAPVTIDLRFVDLSANSGVPLANTSPETAILPGWLPLLETRLNSSLYTANFSDTATSVVVRAAATGETIGTVEPLTANPVEPIIFRWDPTFHGKYLPLNAPATVVTLGSGLDEHMHVSMFDSAQFLIDGGGLLDSALFVDTANVAISDAVQWSILSTYAEAANASIADGPFGGFMPGYDNTLFDFELGTGDPNTDPSTSGYYDAGIPLTDYFQQAQGLAMLPSLTPQQQALFNDLISLLQPYLSPDILTTTFSEFIANVNASDPVNYTPVSTGFGIPAVGMGMSIDQDDAESSSASIVESITVTEVDLGTAYDFMPYDVGLMDANRDSEITLISQTLPPLPSIGLPPAGTLYANYDSPLFVPAPGARIVQVSFVGSLGATPSFHVWRPTDAAPVVIPIVERVSSHVFRFSLPSASELKVIVV